MSSYRNRWNTILQIISSIFLALGCGLVGLGIRGSGKLMNDKISYWIGFSITDTYKEQTLGVLTAVFLVFGPIMILIGITGLWGAANQKKSLLKLYSGLLVLIAFLQTLIGIYFIHIIKNNGSILPLGPWGLNADEDTEHIDKIQRSLKCCGYYGPSEMVNFVGAYPDSCCNDFNPSIGIAGIAVCTPHETGCLYRYLMHLKVRGIIYGAIVAFEILCIVPAVMVLRSIRNGYVFYRVGFKA